MKDEILKILIENAADFTSGEKLSSQLGVSRAAIWKYIKALREEGYEIHSMTNKGYKLIFSPDILTKEELNPLLHNRLIGKNIIHFDTIDSTNSKAKELASQEAQDGTMIISEEQTCGKGRLGRSWHSPKSKGIWTSIILRPKIDPINASKITLIAAASVVKAFNEMDIFPQIKWPNDIVLNKKKVCGILTEMSAEINQIHYLIVGMGINVNNSEEDFTDALSSSATSLKIELASEINRKNLLAKVLTNFELLYLNYIENDSFEETIKICRENSILLGKDIRIINFNKNYEAKAIDLNDEGQLVIQLKDGTIETLVSGEISVRGLYGYV